MKKNLYMLLFAAVALFSAATMVSCSKDDPDPKPEPTPVLENYAKYTAKMSEGIFEYCDVTVTVEVDNKKTVYTFGEETKVSDLETGMKALPGRILDIPVFKFDVHPLHITTDIKLSEAGKQKIAKATTEEFDFVVALDFGECNSKGGYYGKPVWEIEQAGGVHVKEFETFLNNYTKGNKQILDKTFN